MALKTNAWKHALLRSLAEWDLLWENENILTYNINM